MRASITVAGDDAAGVGAGFTVAGGIVGGLQGAAIRAGFFQAVAEGVEAVNGGRAVGGDDLRELIERVVLVLADAAGGVRDLCQAVEGIIGKDVGRMVFRVGEAGAVAVGVVAELGGLAERTQAFLHSAKAVEHRALGFGGAAVGVFQHLLGDVAHQVQGVVDFVAEAVADGGQAVGGIVDKTGIGAIRQGEFGELAGIVIAVSGDLRTGGGAQQSAALVVLQQGNQAVGIFDHQGLAVGVVAHEGGEGVKKDESG